MDPVNGFVNGDKMTMKAKISVISCTSNFVLMGDEIWNNNVLYISQVTFLNLVDSFVSDSLSIKITNWITTPGTSNWTSDTKIISKVPWFEQSIISG